MAVPGKSQTSAVDPELVVVEQKAHSSVWVPQVVPEQPLTVDLVGLLVQLPFCRIVQRGPVRKLVEHDFDAAHKHK